MRRAPERTQDSVFRCQARGQTHHFRAVGLHEEIPDRINPGPLEEPQCPAENRILPIVNKAPAHAVIRPFAEYFENPVVTRQEVATDDIRLIKAF
jgi:hypothetical protein